jgi:hypothetical protein
MGAGRRHRGRPGRVVQPEPAGHPRRTPVCGPGPPASCHPGTPRCDPSGQGRLAGRGCALRPGGADAGRGTLDQPPGPPAGGGGLRRPRRGAGLLGAPGGRDAAAGPGPQRPGRPRPRRGGPPAEVRHPPRARPSPARDPPGNGPDPRLGPTAEEADLAASADRLAELLVETEAGFVSRLPRQLVHGDVWDDNVLFRRGRPVLLADFDSWASGPGWTTWPSPCGARAPTSKRALVPTSCVAGSPGSSPATTPASKYRCQPPSGPRCPWPWPATRCPRSRDGWRTWTTRWPRAATPPVSPPSYGRRWGCWPTRGGWRDTLA